MGGRFRANAPQTIHQTIEGEVVIINLASGSYYSLRDAGARMWELLVAGLSVDEIAADLRARHETSDGEIERAVAGLVDELSVEGLLVPAEGTSEQAADPAPPAAAEPRPPFQRPVLERFEDMQDLILLDPVHEVDQDAGWPHRPEA